ncbi:MAG TPA: PKD domain-containing protein [Pirellula sp.]|nr:PKD domain-containing protein [Pirellula sp.]
MYLIGTSNWITALFLSFMAFLNQDGMCADESQSPRHITVDLNVGDVAEVELADKSIAKVKVLDVQERRDTVRNAIREARVRVEINGTIATISSANYRLPIDVGNVQVDCPTTRGLNESVDARDDPWGLRKDVRLRLWPAGSTWMAPDQLVYPLRQSWFASATQMANEPSFVDGGDAPLKRKTYYHYGLDIGGAEGLTDVIAATDGVVVSAGLIKATDVTNPPVAEREDVVYVRDARNWFYRYSHLKTIDVQLGDKISKGQKIGLVGKEGATAWSHLHFDIKAMQPSGKWGIEEGYAFLWEAYHKQFKPSIIAVARPHHLIYAGEKVMLDGSRSWSASGKIDRFEWTLSDGVTSDQIQIEHKYDKPGQYSETLKVVDVSGNVSYDFAPVLVIDRKLVEQVSPTLHASYWPTFDLRPNDPITFKVRSFFCQPLGETWDFGDGSPLATVRSDGNAQPHAANGYAEVEHRYAKSGDYIVSVKHPGRDGHEMTARLHVRVQEPKPTGEPEVIELWPGIPPDEPDTVGAEYARKSPVLTHDQVEVTDSTRMITNVTKPTISLYRPDPKLNTGTSMLICPGGGYWNLYWELEGEEVARWLTSHGITGIILKYRVPRRLDEDKTQPARRPLQDAQRAMSLVRSRAKEWGLNPDRIGMIGFSAGAHLAIATATHFDARTYVAIDEVDQVSSRPDFAIAAYPGYLKAKDKFELSSELTVSNKTPPVFLVHGSQDPISPPSHSVVFYLALQQAGVPVELHLYASTTHDFGVRSAARPYAHWTDACLRWLIDQGLAPKSGSF